MRSNLVKFEIRQFKKILPIFMLLTGCATPEFYEAARTCLGNDEIIYPPVFVQCAKTDPLCLDRDRQQSRASGQQKSIAACAKQTCQNKHHPDKCGQGLMGWLP
jgi:hypothetical protein